MPYYLILTPAIPNDEMITLASVAAEVMRVLVLQKKLLQRQDGGLRDRQKPKREAQSKD